MLLIEHDQPQSTQGQKNRRTGTHHQQGLALGTQVVGIGGGGWVGVHALAGAVSSQCAVSGWQARSPIPLAGPIMAQLALIQKPR